MTLRVVWEKCAVDNESTGKTTVLTRGADLPDYVSDFVRSTLVMVGAVKEDGAAVAAVQAAKDAEDQEPVAPPVHPPEVPPVVPTPRGTNPDATATVPAPPNPEKPLVKPAANASKDQWEAYAVGKGYMTQTEAESLTKAKLVDAVNEREKA